ncbi:MAG TPA: hypothetical protein P5568_14285, partial [Acidobacteriota bacterium]|nr:hypothetical protein [Acidobacteriota bacterium]
KVLLIVWLTNFQTRQASTDGPIRRRRKEASVEIRNRSPSTQVARRTFTAFVGAAGVARRSSRL